MSQRAAGSSNEPGRSDGTGSGVVGVVLAAGSSERMGGDEPKQLLRFGDLTMVAETVSHANRSQLDRVVVVVGPSAEKVAASIPDGRHEVVENPDHAAGNLTSLRAGAAVAPDADAVVVLLADMPGVAAGVIDALIARWNRDRPWAVITEYADGLPNHPFLLSADALTVALGQDGPKPLWDLLVEEPPQPVDRLPLAERPPVDIDTPEDYAEALRRRGNPTD